MTTIIILLLPLLLSLLQLEQGKVAISNKVQVFK